jgi:hypothetical protein
MNLTGVTQEVIGIAPKSALAAIPTTQSYSVSVWVNMSNIGGYRTFVSADGTTASSFYLQKRGDTGKFAFTFTSVDSDQGAQTPCIVSSVDDPVANQLYHLVATRDAPSGTDILYVDGVEVARATCTDPGWAGTGTISLGHGMYTANKVDQVAGAISGLGLIDRVLTPEEISSLHTRGATYNPAGP